ncbi:MAG: ubiquinol-cytochrome C chaperone family protein [Rhodospirillales bacterium]
MKFLNFLGPRPIDRKSRKIYVSLVKQAREQAFYLSFGVPDTPDGRFDMIVLHAFLLFRRFKQDHERTEALGQAVFDLMFTDMDQNLREMGIGDLGVGKRIKGMAEGFFGRMEAYEKGLNDVQELQNALKRNLFRKSTPSPSQVSAMAAYVQTEAARLDMIDMETLLAADIKFTPPSEDKAKQP